MITFVNVICGTGEKFDIDSWKSDKITWKKKLVDT